MRLRAEMDKGGTVRLTIGHLCVGKSEVRMNDDCRPHLVRAWRRRMWLKARPDREPQTAGFRLTIAVEAQCRFTSRSVEETKALQRGTVSLCGAESGDADGRRRTRSAAMATAKAHAAMRRHVERGREKHQASYRAVHQELSSGTRKHEPRIKMHRGNVGQSQSCLADEASEG